MIDVAGYVPSVVRSAARLLASTTALYAFVSTRSVYAEVSNSTEDGPVATMTDAEVDAAEAIAVDGRSNARLYGKHYGALKARCEAAAQQEMGANRTLVVRPGLLSGPLDNTDRFTYWPLRVAEGGDILAPGRPDRLIRVLDARDLADWIVRLLERGTTGTFNAAGEDGVTMQRLLEACAQACNPATAPRFVWVPEKTLLDAGVTPWVELPLWVPEEVNAFLETNNDKAIAAGLTFRPLERMATETLAWARSRGDVTLQAGLSRDKERALLESSRA